MGRYQKRGKNVRPRTLLKDFVNDELDKELPQHIRANLPEHVQSIVDLHDGITHMELLSKCLVSEALGTIGYEAAKEARKALLSLQPKQVDVQAEVEIATESGLAGSLARISRRRIAAGDPLKLVGSGEDSA